MRRQNWFLSMVLGASLLGGCLPTGPEPTGSPTPPAPGQQQTPAPSTPPAPAPSTPPAPAPSTPPAPAPSTPPAPSPAPSTPPAPLPNLDVTTTLTTASLKLNTTHDVPLNVVVPEGFTGMVTLTATGLPKNVTATFAPASPMSMTAGTTPVVMTLHAASDAASAASTPIKIHADATGTTATDAALGLTVEAELVIGIAKGVQTSLNGRNNPMAFGATSFGVLFVMPGTKITFVNNDAQDHRIHASDAEKLVGFVHEPSNLLANAANSYTVTITKPGKYPFDCHLHPTMVGEIDVIDPNAPAGP